MAHVEKMAEEAMEVGGGGGNPSNLKWEWCAALLF